jgi:23S rRNA G2069 N7-methylase RlmK/C1962 C5-methylase RlmI
MKHAGPDALDRLEPLLAELRKREGMKEKSRGIFYRGSKAFLHFHEHGVEFFADLRTEEDFERFPATKEADRASLLKRVDALLGDGNRPSRR